jgi:hypothetical protein
MVISQVRIKHRYDNRGSSGAKLATPDCMHEGILLGVRRASQGQGCTVVYYSVGPWAAYAFTT